MFFSGPNRFSRRTSRRIIPTAALPPLDGAAVERLVAAVTGRAAPDPELESLRARLRAVEKRSRWFLAAVLGALLVALFAGGGRLLSGQAPSGDGALEGQRFSLKDAAGQERAWLGMDHGQPVLRFLDAAGHTRASLELSGPGLVVRATDARGRMRAGLGLDDHGVALVAFDKDGRPLVGDSAFTNRVGNFAPASEGSTR